MEPLVALGLASSIAQLLDFGSKVFRETVHICSRGKGNAACHLKYLSGDLSRINDILLGQYQGFEESSLTDAEKGLMELARQCRDNSERIREFIESLDVVMDDEEQQEGSSKEQRNVVDLNRLKSRLGIGNKAKDQKLSEEQDQKPSKGKRQKGRKKTKWKGAKLVLRTVWHRDTIDELITTHAEYRAQLNTRLLVVLNSCQMQQSAMLKDVHSKSDTIIEAFAIHSHDRFAQPGAIGAILPRDDGPPTILGNISGQPSRSTDGQNISGHINTINTTRFENPTRMTRFPDHELRGSDKQRVFSTGQARDHVQLILDALHFREIHQREHSIEAAHARTFTWALEPVTDDKRDGLLEWLQAGSGCYWIEGKAGSGKSSLVKYILGEKRFTNALQTWSTAGGKRHQLVVGSFYFWYAGTTEQKSHTGLLRGLLLSVFQARSSLGLAWALFEDVCRQITTGILNGPIVLTEAELRLAFRRLTDAVPESMSICFVVDGLDEYIGDLNELCDLFVHTTKSPSIKMILAGRPVPVCCERFKHCPYLRLQDLTKSDIQIYITDHLGENPILKEIEEPDTVARLVDIIVTGACGVFLWVVLVVRLVIAGLQRSSTIPELEDEINSLPPDLEQLYERMLSSIHHRDQRASSKYLQLAIRNLEVSQARPMTPLQLSFAEDDDYQGVIHNPLPRLSETKAQRIAKSIERRLRSRCWGLLEFQRTITAASAEYVTIGFMHRTVVEFLQLRNNWEKMTLLTAGTSFDAHVALVASTVAELQSIPQVSSDQWSDYSWPICRLLRYCEKLPETVQQALHQTYLPAAQKALRELHPLNSIFPRPDERCEVVQRAMDKTAMRFKLNFRRAFALSCFISAPPWVLNMEDRERLGFTSNQLVVTLLISFVEETDGRICSRIGHAISTLKFDPSAKILQHGDLGHIWHFKWKNIVPDYECWTPWQFLLRFIQVTVTIESEFDKFNFHDAHAILSLMDLILLMLRRKEAANDDLHDEGTSFSATPTEPESQDTYALLLRFLKLSWLMASSPMKVCQYNMGEIAGKARDIYAFFPSNAMALPLVSCGDGSLGLSIGIAHPFEAVDRGAENCSFPWEDRCGF